VPYGHSWGEAAEAHAIGEQQLKWMQSGNNGWSRCNREQQL